MKRFLVPLVFLSACASLTLLHTYKETILVNAGTGDLPAGSHEIICEEYLTEEDQTIELAQGTPLNTTYFSAQCTVRIEGKGYRCFYDNYSSDPIGIDRMKGACAGFISAWTRPKQSSGGGGGGGGGGSADY